ncbi:hypothetical protein [Chryseobacterium sp. MYb328]|uniref:hypothetical protein n=1 Tax=Chryseobacterium sp. MYb328 TaxID=2745231 RepID=UPI0030AC7378
MRKKIILFLCIFLLSKLYSQGGKIGIDTSNPHQKTVLDIVSKGNNTGVLFPRLKTSDVTSIGPAMGDALVDGLWVYNTDTKCYNYWAAAPQNQWLQICGTPITGVSTGSAVLNCAGATSTGNLVNGQAASGVSFTIPYTAGNGGPYAAQSIASTGVTGLTAAIAAGNLNNGSGSLTYTVSGTPASAGTVSFAVTIGGSTCTVNFTVNAGYDLSKLKILSVGASPFGVDGTTSGLGAVMNNPFIFSSYYPGGSNPAAMIQTTGQWSVTRRVVSSGGINDLNIGGYKLLLVSYTYDLTSAAEVSAVQMFVNNGGTVIWYSETTGANTLNMIRAYAGAGATQGTWSDCFAYNIPSSSALNGDFGDARNTLLGNDACTSRDLSNYDSSLIEAMSVSQTTGNVVAFKSKTKEFYWFGDGGVTRYNGTVPPVSGNTSPWLLDANKKPVIGQWNGQGNVANSIVMMNIIVKALKAAQ